jgi:hypothetical protein
VPYAIEYSPEFGPSMMRAATINAGRFDVVGLSMAIAKFVEWKRAGGSPPPPFTDDKWSGRRPDGVEFRPYIRGNFRHCHLDLDGTDPLLAYRQWDDEQRIYLVCITSHREMFHGAERRFYRLYSSLGSGRRI